MKQKEVSVVVIGQLTLDDIISTTEPIRFDTPGGNTLYALSGAWMCGKELIGIVTRRGIDYDLSFLNPLEDRIDLSGVVTVEDSPSIHLLCLFDRKGNRYFIQQRWGGHDNNMSYYPEEIPQSYYNTAKAFLFCPTPVEYQARVIKAMPDGKIVMVDPHYDTCYPNDWEIWDSILPKITIFAPSEAELVRFFSIPMQQDLIDYRPYIKKLAQKGPKVVVIKAGERGALIYDRALDCCWHIPTVSSQVVDVTGCGDTFCGAFLSDYSIRQDPFCAALYGTVAASFNIEHFSMKENFMLKESEIEQRYLTFSSQVDREKNRIF